MLGCGAGCGSRRLFGHARRRAPAAPARRRRTRRPGRRWSGSSASRPRRCRHLLGQVENVIRVRRGLVRRRVEPRQHRIDVVLLHGCMAAARAAGDGGTGWRGGMAAGRGAARRRRRRLGGGRLGGIVVGDDAANGGENFLHRRLLRLRRLAHCRIPTCRSRQSPHDARGIRTPAANHPLTQYLLGSSPSMARRMSNANAALWIRTYPAPRRRPGTISCELFSVGRAHADPGVAHLMVVHRGS